MKPMAIAELRSRWKNLTNNTSDKKTDRWFLGTHLNDHALSPFGQFGGREDFRGIDLSGKFRGTDCLISDTDFSHANLTEAYLTGTVFANCIFDNTNFTLLRQWGVCFQDCSFRNTNFTSAAFGADGGTYTHCTFDRARFSGTSFLQPEFDECTFLGCNLRGVDFFMAQFSRCKFSGKLIDVQFKGFHPPELWKAFGIAPPNRMFKVDFSEAIFNDVGFSFQCDLSTVTIPNDGLHVFVPNLSLTVACIERELTQISDAQVLAGAAIWVPLLRQFAMQQEAYIVSGHDLRADGILFADQFLELIRRCSKQQKQGLI